MFTSAYVLGIGTDKNPGYLVSEEVPFKPTTRVNCLREPSTHTLSLIYRLLFTLYKRSKSPLTRLIPLFGETCLYASRGGGLA